MSAGAETRQVRLDLVGMTCASCASRIERRLNRLDGVRATVNFATEQATVQYPSDVSVDSLISTVDAAGYGARQTSAASGHDHHDGARVLAWRLAAAVVLTIPVVLLSAVPALR